MPATDNLIIVQRILQRPAWIESNFDANGSPCEGATAVPRIRFVLSLSESPEIPVHPTDLDQGSDE